MIDCSENRWSTMFMEAPTDRLMKCRCAFAVIGVAVGISVCVVFAVVFRNPDTAAWALASGMIHGGI